MTQMPHGPESLEGLPLDLPMPPEASPLEELATITSSALGGLLGPAGAFLAPATQSLLGGPLRRRREAWWRDVEEAIQAGLDARGRRLSAEEGEETLDALERASRIATADSRELKRRALLNALCNVISGTAPTRDRQAGMMRLLDELGEVHLLAMGFLSRRAIIERESGVQSEFDNLVDLLAAGVDCFNTERDWAEEVAQELVGHGFLVSMVERDDDGGSFSLGTPWDPRQSITPKAEAFMAFIEGPFSVVPNEGFSG